MPVPRPPTATTPDCTLLCVAFCRWVWAYALDSISDIMTGFTTLPECFAKLHASLHEAHLDTRALCAPHPTPPCPSSAPTPPPPLRLLRQTPVRAPRLCQTPVRQTHKNAPTPPPPLCAFLARETCPCAQINDIPFLGERGPLPKCCHFASITCRQCVQCQTGGECSGGSARLVATRPADTPEHSPPISAESGIRKALFGDCSGKSGVH